ncbi:MAG TPA: DEAD/DEAH box helicase, partial [Hyphomonas sp.]|nr:DEAD/DEAH box helicase [Hyphomonas sp.]
VYGSQMKLTTAIVVGGVKPGGQVRALARGVDVLVATPGRLLDHMETGAVNLSGTEAVVLDEADQMMDMG